MSGEINSRLLEVTYTGRDPRQGRNGYERDTATVGTLGSSALLFIFVTIFCTETGKTWRVTYATRRTVRRIQAIEGEILDIEHYKSHPDDLLALIGAMVLRSMVRLALLVILLLLYILVRADRLRASNVPTKALSLYRRRSRMGGALRLYGRYPDIYR